MDIVDRISSCRAFAERQCSHQVLMDRLYLIYQILRQGELRTSEALCRSCRESSGLVFPPSAPSDRVRCSNA